MTFLANFVPNGPSTFQEASRICSKKDMKIGAIFDIYFPETFSLWQVKQM